MTTTAALTQTAESQAALAPAAALDRLRDGNRRFLAAETLDRLLLDQVRETASEQFPFAVVLGCIDSRVPVETVFDQGIGDIFTARVAGNVVNADVLGSMEFACRIIGSKAILVLGHTSCGAVEGAIAEVELGNLTELVGKVRPAVETVRERVDDEEPGFADLVSEENVRRTLATIRDGSPVLAAMEADGEIALAGAVYDVSTGMVRFL